MIINTKLRRQDQNDQSSKIHMVESMAFCCGWMEVQVLHLNNIKILPSKDMVSMLNLDKVKCCPNCGTEITFVNLEENKIR